MLHLHDPEIEERLEAMGIRDNEEKERWLRDALRETLRCRELVEQFEAEVRKGEASGPGLLWTAEDWQQLKRGEYRYPPEPESWAVPPGWKSPRAE